MRILIIVTNYMDQKVISSKRWRCLSKELAKLGNEVYVIANDDNYNIDKLTDEYIKAFNGIHYVKIGKKTNYGNVRVSEFKKRNGKLDILRLVYGMLKEGCVRQNSNKKVKRVIESEKLNDIQFDYVIASVHNIETFYMAKYVLQKGYAKELICDIRDYLNGKIYCRPELDIIGRMQIRDIARHAKYIFTVNGGIKNWVLQEVGFAYKRRLIVIPHCVDWDEDVYKDVAINSGMQLVIAYTGSCYPGRRIMDPIFKAIQTVGKKKIRLVVAGKDNSEFHKWAKEYQMEDVLDDKGYVDRTQAMRLQQEADVLFYMTFVEEDSEYCGMSGKFPEYLASGKKIISLVNAETTFEWYKRECELLELGVVCDVKDDNNGRILASFLLEQLERKQQNGFLAKRNGTKQQEEFDVRLAAARINELLSINMV